MLVDFNRHSLVQFNCDTASLAEDVRFFFQKSGMEGEKKREITVESSTASMTCKQKDKIDTNMW